MEGKPAGTVGRHGSLLHAVTRERITVDDFSSPSFNFSSSSSPRARERPGGGKFLLHLVSSSSSPLPSHSSSNNRKKHYGTSYFKSNSAQIVP